MKCYTHSGVDAVGSCKACGKGICHECATDLGHGLACTGVHETRVENLNTIISKNIDAMEAAPKNLLILPVFYLVMGMVFAYFGYASGRGISALASMLGIAFTVFAIVMFVRNRALYRDISIKREP